MNFNIDRIYVSKYERGPRATVSVCFENSITVPGFTVWAKRDGGHFVKGPEETLRDKEGNVKKNDRGYNQTRANLYFVDPRNSDQDRESPLEKEVKAAVLDAYLQQKDNAFDRGAAAAANTNRGNHERVPPTTRGNGNAPAGDDLPF